MNLYRLDTPAGPVCDLMGPRLIRVASFARTEAKVAARVSGQDVTVSRISGAGHLRRMYTVHPDGSTTTIPKPTR